MAKTWQPGTKQVPVLLSVEQPLHARVPERHAFFIVNHNNVPSRLFCFENLLRGFKHKDRLTLLPGGRKRRKIKPLNLKIKFT